MVYTMQVYFPDFCYKFKPLSGLGFGLGYLSVHYFQLRWVKRLTLSLFTHAVLAKFLDPVYYSLKNVAQVDVKRDTRLK